MAGWDWSRWEVMGDESGKLAEQDRRLPAAPPSAR